MAEYITGINTEDGVRKYDYNALGNLPKAYESTGENTDGWMSQKATTDAVRGSANAFKSRSLGQIVFHDDVSPVEHIVKCTARSKNLFNDLSDYKNGEYTYENGTLTVAVRYIHKFILLEAGKTYTFSCKSTRSGTTGGGVHIRAYTEDQKTYVDLPGASVINILSPTVTVTLPKGYPCIRFALYGHATATDTGTATYTELMLEEGTEATGYVPYTDPKAATVTQCGANLLPFPYSTSTSTKGGVTFTVNANRSITLSGTATADVQFDLATELSLPAGTYNFAGNGNNIRARILKPDGSFVYSLDEVILEEGDKLRLYAVALSGETINYTVFPMLNYGDLLVYEDYTGATYMPDANGIISNMKSLSPAMTLMSNIPEVLVDCEYNLDSNRIGDYIGGAGGAGIASVEQTATSTQDGGVNTLTITLTDGSTSTLDVRNGTKGSTPQKGTDYWTNEDKEELAAYAANSVKQEVMAPVNMYLEDTDEYFVNFRLDFTTYNGLLYVRMCIEDVTIGAYWNMSRTSLSNGWAGFSAFENMINKAKSVFTNTPSLWSGEAYIKGSLHAYIEVNLSDSTVSVTVAEHSGIDVYVDDSIYFDLILTPKVI